MPDADDKQLAKVIAVLRAVDPDGARFGRTLRRTYDEIYDGRNTGRFRWEQLTKLERTHFGPLVEINLQREFSFDDGLDLDYRIADAEVDCKWSLTDGRWMLPPQVIGKVCLLVTGSDEKSVWSAGLARTVGPLLISSSNGDDDMTLDDVNQPTVHWIWKDKLLPENVLLHSNPDLLHTILVDLGGPRRRQKRLDELFRRLPNRVIGSGVVSTITQQDYRKKRVRIVSKSRQNLKPEGIIVFGDYLGHRKLASRLGLPPMSDGDSMSARLIRTDGPSDIAVQLGGASYRLCIEGEEPTKPAPDLPNQNSSVARVDSPKLNKHAIT